MVQSTIGDYICSLLFLPIKQAWSDNLFTSIFKIILSIKLDIIKIQINFNVMLIWLGKFQL
jgi:hypothetical protein